MTHDHLLDEIRADLASFADTHSKIQLDGTTLAWRQNGERHDAQLVQGTDASYPDVQIHGSQHDYRTFLASQMANLDALAESLYVGLPEESRYVESKAVLEGLGDPAPVRGVIARLLESPPYGSTRVIFLRGAAGAGKTVALKHLARRQAEAYLERRSDFLYFYIDAQARSLARLDEAVALVLQDANARFTYRALATLTKHRLVVPIIDGFDELLGTSGGGEAVDALTLFLGRLSGSGVVVASARSTYFDFRNLRASADRLQSVEARFEIAPVDLRAWSSKEMCEYLVRDNQYLALGERSPEAALETLQRKFEVDQSDALFSTPFFLSAAVEVAREEDEPRERVRPIRRIIESFVRREVGKLRNVNDEPILREGDHWQFLHMLAEEMWWQERRELDRASVDAVAELFAESIGMTENDLRVFTARASSYAFLGAKSAVAGTGRSMLTFSHEYYYAFFLASFLASRLVENDDVAGLLGRSSLSPTVSAQFGEYLKERSESVSPILAALAERQVPVLTRETNRANAGALYEAAIRNCEPLDELVLFDASFTGADFSSTRQSGVSALNCDFVDVDFRDAEWSFVESPGSTFVRIAVDPVNTRFKGLKLVSGSTLYGVSQRGGRVEYEPSNVAAVCAKVGIELPSEAVPVLPVYSERAEAVVDLLDKLLRVAERMYYLSDGILAQRSISNHTEWSTLERMLQEHQIIEHKTAQRRGPDGQLRRLTFPPSVIAEGEARPANSDVGACGRAMRRL
ncbi:MAG: NACHT domain-containing protein [Holophagales bacterium]|nr:NACHT domain-containing protein [Holophagales bacterium]